jgi:hypothetical protein
VRRYHAALVAAGVREYPFPRQLHDYRRALLERAMGAVGLVGGAVRPTPARLETARRMLARARVALESFDPLPLLDGDP